MLSSERHREEDGRAGATEAVGGRESRGPDGLEDSREDEDEPVHDVSSAAVLSLGGYGSLVRERIGRSRAMVRLRRGPGESVRYHPARD